MLIGPNGERRPENPIEAAILAARILVGDLEEPEEVEEAGNRPPSEEYPRRDSNPQPSA